MSEDLLSFNSPLLVKNNATMNFLECSKIPLIPCPSLPSESNPFDSVALAATREDDPFETVTKLALPLGTPERSNVRQSCSLPTSPNQSIRGIEATLNKSEFDLTGAVFERQLISSTPNSSRIFAQTRTRARSCSRTNLSSRREIFQEPPQDQLTAEQVRNIVKQKMEYLDSINRSVMNINPPVALRKATSMSSFFLPDSTKPLSNSKRLDDSLNSSYTTALDNSTNSHSPAKSFNSLHPSDQRRVKRDASLLAYYIEAACFEEDDLMAELPPWNSNPNSSGSTLCDDDDGLPTIRKLRLSTTAVDLDDSVDSIITRYEKARNSFQMEDKDPENAPPKQSVENVKSDESTESNDVCLKVPEGPQTRVPVEIPVPALPIPIPLPIVTKDESRLAKKNSNIPKKGPMKALVPLPKITGSATKLKIKADGALNNSNTVQNQKFLVPRSKSSDHLLNNRNSPKVASEGRKFTSTKVSMRQALKPMNGQIAKFGIKKKDVNGIGLDGKENNRMMKK